MEALLTKIQALLSYNPLSPLIFSSGLFLYLFVGFLAGYWLLKKTSRLRILYVVAFSLYFYYKSSGWYFVLLLLAATYDYLIGYSLYFTKGKTERKLLLAMSVVMNLSMLCYFKYTNFLIDLTNQLFGAGFLDFQNIFLPVGISFFVFQSMSYTIDIYRGQLRPLDSWLDYLFYLSFFPQLVAGPIVRASNFIPQIRQKPVVTREMLGTAPRVA